MSAEIWAAGSVPRLDLRTDHRPLEGQTGDLQRKGPTCNAVFNLTKSMFGAGLLGIPHAVFVMGRNLGAVLFLITLFVVTYTMALVAEAKLLVEENGSSEVTTYAKLAYAAFDKKGQVTVEVLVVLLQLCFCSGYVIVMTTCLHNLQWLGEDRAFIILAAAPVLLVLCSVRFIKDLWVVSLFGFVVYTCGLIGIIVFDGISSPQQVLHQPEESWSQVPFTFGTLLYAMEAVLSVLPNARSLERPQMATAVVYMSLALYSVVALPYLYLAMAFGFARCGDVVNCFTPGLPSKVALCVVACSVTISYPLSMYVATELVEERLKIGSRAQRLMVRCPAVAITCIVAYSIPSFARFTGVAGGILITTLGIVLPTVLYVRICKIVGCQISCRKRLALGFCAAVGSLSACLGIYDAIKQS
eukprot:gnl/TRDRNA2_/TRDRNA2_145176_c0_seq1.p1 gnl/TRDRNA2_/TRDRNA2_145176_c0~~gnl/TRDRNA2_/TRDRNA2_145176_c0_seq1.p1  ORF type:complete len:435 (+),score=54.59 gnl/TRDRNA2_/TRDRNA2_145176_c0_seq1:66-1307(+)